MKLAQLISSIALVALVGSAMAQYTETEPNDSLATANAFTMNPGEYIEGTSTSSSGAGLDYFRVKTSLSSLGIYQYRLVLTSQTAGHTATIRGQGQTGATAGTWPGPVGTGNGSETAAQTSSTTTNPPRYVQWYGFGKGEEIYYRVTGTSSTTAPYRATLERTAITPIDLGIFQVGNITISTLGLTNLDTDLWVYDSNFNPIPGYGNDDKSDNSGPPAGTSTQSLLIRNFGPGVYYIALSRFNLINEMGSPCDDNFRTGTMLYRENAGAVLSSASTSTTSRIGISITDIDNNTATHFQDGMQPYEIIWYKFTVPEPASMIALGAGLAGLVGLRRRKK